jgi:hypothetical protein
MKKTICIFLLVFSLTSPAHAVLISDGDFAAWSPFHFVTDDPTWPGLPPVVSTGTGQRVATGGYYDAFFRLSHTFTTGDTSWVGAIKTDLSYDPAVEGAIADLSITTDVESDNGASAWQLVIEQAGQRYYSFPFGVTVAGGWQEVSASNLTATDFDTNPWAGSSGVAPDGNHPDFGPTAAPLRFGFMFGNKVSGGVATLSNTFGLDNYSLTITSSAVVRIPGAGGFNSLQSAYNSASPNCTIQAQAVDLPDFPFTLNLDNNILLECGYDGSYTAKDGYTTLHGVLTLVNGTLTVDNLIISSYVPPPAAPDGVTAAAGNSQVTISWNSVSGASSYNLYYSTSPGVSKLNGTKITGVTSPYSKTSLINGTPYYFVVTALNGDNESVESAQVSATPSLPVPPPPDGVSVVAGNGQVTVSWTGVSAAASYNLYYSTSPGVTRQNGTKIAGVTSPYIKTLLTNGTHYYFVVTAVNTGGESIESAQVSATPTFTYPYNGNCGNSVLQGTWYESTGIAYTHFPAQIQFVNIDNMSGYFYGYVAGTLGYGFQVEPVMCGSIDVYDGAYNQVVSYGYTLSACELVLTSWGKEHHYCRGGIGNCSSCTLNP